jgi:hypothetical protein
MSRRLWLALGYALFAVGFVGLFVPVMPTTIFWIFAALCFARSSKAMYERIVSWPGVGEAVAAYLDHGVIGRRSKAIALAGIAGGAVVVYLLAPAPPWAVVSSVVFVGSAAYVVTRPGRAPASAEAESLERDVEA